jgi:ribonuclease HI
MASSLTTPGTTFERYFDGSAKPNPGVGGWGVQYRSIHGNSEKSTTYQSYGRLGGEMTSNLAEYMGLINGLRQLLLFCQALSSEASPSQMSVNVYGDSQLVINQMNGSFKVTNERLRLYHALAMHLACKFLQVNYCSIPRDQNEEADALLKKGVAKEIQTNEHETYYPSLYRPFKFRLSGSKCKPLYGTSSLGAAGGSQYSMIDAQFLYSHLGSPSEFPLKEWTHTVGIRGRAQYNVLGVLPSLSFEIHGNDNDEDDLLGTFEVKDVLVVDEFAVPFHFQSISRSIAMNALISSSNSSPFITSSLFGSKATNAFWRSLDEML